MERFSGEARPTRPSTGVFVGVVMIKQDRMLACPGLAKTTEVLLSTGVLVGMVMAKSTGVHSGATRIDVQRHQRVRLSTGVLVARTERVRPSTGVRNGSEMYLGAWCSTGVPF